MRGCRPRRRRAPRSTSAGPSGARPPAPRAIRRRCRPIGSSNLDVRGGIFAAGVDYRVSPDTVIGFAVAGGTQPSASTRIPASGRSDAVQAGVYGSTRFGNAYLSAAAAYGRHDVSTDAQCGVHRHVRPPHRRLWRRRFGGRIEGGYRLAAAAASASRPTRPCRRSASRPPNYGETDRTGVLAFALNYAGQDGTIPAANSARAPITACDGQWRAAHATRPRRLGARLRHRPHDQCRVPGAARLRLQRHRRLARSRQSRWSRPARN